MGVWQELVAGLGAALLVVLVYGAALVFRRRWIGREGGTFDLSYRRLPLASRSEGTVRGWVLGLGRYSGDALEFFRVFSILPGPTAVLHRAGLAYEGQRQAVGNEAHALYAGHVVIRCSGSPGDVELAMAPEAVTGFLAWLEASPPGARQLPH